jgi:hypothetical protein
MERTRSSRAAAIYGASPTVATSGTRKSFASYQFMIGQTKTRRTISDAPGRRQIIG